MINENFPTLNVGSKVFVFGAGALEEHTITAFHILNCSGELKCQVETEVGAKKYPRSCYLDTFIKGIETAQDMKISDIRR